MSNELITIKGILIPVEWDEQGNALAVALMGMDEEEHLIEPNGKGRELIRFMRQKMEISGVVQQISNGRKMITVKAYISENPDQV